MENFDLGIEVLADNLMVRVEGLGLQWINQAYSLSNMVPLDGVFALDIHTNRLGDTGFHDRNPVLMDSFDDDLLEITVFVRTEHQLLIEFD